jgi:hypothetical protein
MTTTSKPKIEFPGDKPTGKTRSFHVTIHATMTLDESVIAQGVTDDGCIMRSPTEDEVLQHLAYNLVGEATSLSDIDGFANCPDESAVVSDRDVEIEYEIKPSRKSGSR